MKCHVLTALALAAPALAFAQPAPAPALVTDFPVDARPLSTEELQTKMNGKVFRLRYADGVGVRLDVRNGGWVFADLSNGGRGKGRWRVEGSAWCDAFDNAATDGCNEMRLGTDGVLLLKRRSNGEVVAMRE